MHVKMVGALIISMYLGKLLPMELPDTITVVSRDAREFVITKDIFSLSNTFLFLLPGGAQETRFHFREFNSDEFEEMLELMTPIAHLQQNGSKRYVKFQKAKEKLWFLSTKSLEELGGLMVIANFLDIDSLQQILAYFIARQLDPRLSAKDINDVFEKLNIAESENPKKYITKELELKQVSKNPLQKSDRLLFCNHESGTKRQEIKATILDEGDFSWRKLPMEVQLQMFEMYLLSQTNPTEVAKELLERIRTLTFTDLPIEVKEHIFLYLIKRDETIFQQFKQLSVLSQINRQTRTLFHPHCQAYKLAIAQQLVKSNKQQAEKIFLKLCSSDYPDIDAVKAFVTSGIDINIKDTLFGHTALIMAANNGHAGVVKLLLENGADINATSYAGITALICASSQEIVKLLVDNGANVYGGDNDSNTALIKACAQGHKNIVQLLLGMVCYDNYTELLLTLLILASQEGHTEVVKLLIDYGADVNGLNGNTALIAASYNGHKDVVQLLLRYGANVNAVNNHGDTALMFASNKGHKEVVTLLLDMGAHVNVISNSGETALTFASSGGHKDVVQLLLGYGAHVNVADSTGYTALMYASRSGKKEVVELLVDNGAKVCGEDNDSNTDLIKAYAQRHSISYDNYSVLLTSASREGNTEVVKLLLDKGGANVNEAYSNGYTVLMFAVWAGHKEVVKLLTNAGADVNAEDSNGRTALMYAAGNDHKEIVEHLINAGADVNAKDHMGNTAVSCASSAGYKEVVKLLRGRGACRY